VGRLKWNVSSSEKTVVMHFGHNNPHHQYTLSESFITSALCTKDLGVHINVKCTPSDHVIEVTKKANGVLAQIRRSTISRSSEMITKLYTTYVRPIIESSVQVWNPWLRRDIDHIEKVQRRATKLVSGIGSKPYNERLKICKLTTLEERRTRGDLLESFKIMNNFTNVEKSDFFEFAKNRHQMNTRGAAEDLLVPQMTKLDIRKYFFSNRIVQAWNDLPLEIRMAPSVNGFKNNYDDYTHNANDRTNH